MTPVIKICGVTHADDARAARAAGATHVGLVFHDASPRAVTPDDAAALIDAAGRGGLSWVALVAGPAPAALAALVDAVRPDVVQFHGRESLAALGAATAALPAPRPTIWRAVGVSTAADVADVAPGPADALLFDARPPAGAACEGGHGVAFDRAALRAYRAARPFVLAGGLTPDNVGPAVREARAVPGFCGVDVSSGVERAGTGKRRKDPEKIARFVQAAVAAFAEEPAQCASGA